MRGTINEQGESLTATEQLYNSMNLPDKHPSSVNFDGQTGLSYQNDASDPQWHYQGRSAQPLRFSSPPYFSQSAADQNDAHCVCPLTGFHITSVTQSASDDFYVLDIPYIPWSSINRYVPEYDAESADDELTVISSSYHCVQPSLSAIEPGIKKPTPANRLNSDHHLTNLPVQLANPQDSRPVAVANPLNLQQSTSYNPVNSTKIVTDKSLRAERRRERYRNDPVFAERIREYQRNRRKNPAYAERQRKRQRELHRERYRTDPTYVEHRKACCRERYNTDPAYAERRRAQNRERYRTYPLYAKRIRKKAIERRKNDHDFAEGQKIYIRVYNRMKNKIGKEEASKLAATAREVYLQSVNGPENSADLPQTSTSAESRQNVNENSDAPPFFLRNEPDIRESASANFLHPDYHLTNLLSEFANPQDSQPVAVASPPGVEVSENLPSSISESSDSTQASGAAGQFFASPPKQMPITLLDAKERCQDVTSEVSVKSEKADSGRESEITIMRVWSMATEEGSHFVNNSHQHSDIQTSPIIQADNLGNEFVGNCFTQKNAMIRHQPIHKDDQPYKCKYCDKCYSQRSDLLFHLRTHAGNKPYECKDCDKCYSRKSGLFFHLRTHAGNKPYECKQCLKRFAQKCDLTRHERIHTGERPFECEQCNRRFTQKNHLKTHWRTHTSEKPFECKQ